MNLPLQYVAPPAIQGGINGAANPRRRPAVAPGQMPQPHYYVHEGPDGALHVDQEPF